MSYDAYVKATNPFRGRKGPKPVYSLSLSFSPATRLPTKDNMLKAADEVRHVLGLQDHQCVIIQHTDTKHPHVHLIFNRVHPTTGKYASVSNDRLKLSEWAHDWEKRTARSSVRHASQTSSNAKKTVNGRQKRERAGRTTRRRDTSRARGCRRPRSNSGGSTAAPISSEVRAARAEYQKRDYESYRRMTDAQARKRRSASERANGRTLDRIERTLKVLKGEAPARGQRRSRPPCSMSCSVRCAVRPTASWLGSRTAPTSPS